jgi:hypothetical protein
MWSSEVHCIADEKGTEPDSAMPKLVDTTSLDVENVAVPVYAGLEMQAEVAAVPPAADTICGTATSSWGAFEMDCELAEQRNGVGHMEAGSQVQADVSTKVPFDLNAVYSVTEDQVDAERVLNTSGPLMARAVLGVAETRLNISNRDVQHHKGGARSMAKFVAPLKKALLCNPKVVQTKRCTNGDAACVGLVDKKKGAKGLARQPGAGCPLEVQATALVLKSCGVLAAGKQPSEQAEEQLGERLTAPMQEDLVHDIREAFGIKIIGGTDVLGALTGVAAVDDD